MQSAIDFKCYEIMTPNGPMKVVEDSLMDHDVLFAVDLSKMERRAPKPDTRSRFEKFVADWKRRLSHALDALKGYDCD